MWKYVIIFMTFYSVANPCIPQLDDRIVGGNQVDIEQFPHQVSFQYEGYHSCGGSIVSKNFVLTAGHCVKGKNVEQIAVRAGSNNHMTGGTLHKAVQAIAHPSYHPKTRDYDFALVEVTPPFNLESMSIAVIKIAEFEPPDHLPVFVTGWGTTSANATYIPDFLMGVRVIIANRSICNIAYSKIDLGVTERMICASASGKDSCQGDSGGPLIDPVTKTLYGVISWGYGCAEEGFLGVYANVAHQKDWIKQNICR